MYDLNTTPGVTMIMSVREDSARRIMAGTATRADWDRAVRHHSAMARHLSGVHLRANSNAMIAAFEEMNAVPE